MFKSKEKHEKVFMSEGRILGIDYGDVRVGLALSDELGFTAQRLCTLDVKEDNVMDSIRNTIRQYDIKKIILGFPKNMNGSVGPMGEEVLKFKVELESGSGVQVVLVDERLSTQAAHRVMNEGKIKRKKKKAIVDQIAAQIILQNYLDQPK